MGKRIDIKQQRYGITHLFPHTEKQLLIKISEPWKRNRIRTLIYGGLDISEICRRVIVSKNTVMKCLRVYGYRYEVMPMHLGYKNEPYMSESDMLNGFQVNPSDLKGWELEQYNKRMYGTEVSDTQKDDEAKQLQNSVAHDLYSNQHRYAVS